ncbi:MAG TPA: hypothetical protein VHB46_01585 [Burkholderiales bacterium]|nr:hypothetical protein [Burkholderiales bacterium]
MNPLYKFHAAGVSGPARRYANGIAGLLLVGMLAGCGGGGGGEGVGSQAQAAGRIFVDNFESGTTSKWQQVDYRNRCAVVSSSIDGVAGPHGGNFMLRCRDNGTVAWNDPASFETLALDTNYSRELFVRAWVRVDQNMQQTTVSPKKILRIFDWTGTQATYNDIFESLYPGPNLVNTGTAGGLAFTTYWGPRSGDTTASPNGWHKVEYYISTSGVIRAWHDGIMVQNFSGLPTASARWTPFTITSNWSDAHGAANDVYFDDVEVFSDAASGATGSMADATISVPGS